MFSTLSLVAQKAMVKKMSSYELMVLLDYADGELLDEVKAEEAYRSSPVMGKKLRMICRKDNVQAYL